VGPVVLPAAPVVVPARPLPLVVPPVTVVSTVVVPPPVLVFPAVPVELLAGPLPPPPLIVEPPVLWAPPPLVLEQAEAISIAAKQKTVNRMLLLLLFIKIFMRSIGAQTGRNRSTLNRTNPLPFMRHKLG
jgi:hypothetical protein